MSLNLVLILIFYFSVDFSLLIFLLPLSEREYYYNMKATAFLKTLKNTTYIEKRKHIKVVVPSTVIKYFSTYTLLQQTYFLFCKQSHGKHILWSSRVFYTLLVFKNQFVICNVFSVTPALNLH